MNAAEPASPRLEGCLNFRDVGGLRTRDGRRVRRGLLYRSDTLQFLTAEAGRVLHENIGIRTVIDLRLPLEVRREGRGVLERLPHRYISLPFGVGELVAEDSAVVRFHGDDPVVSSYLGFLQHSPGAVAAVPAALADEGALPAMVHCTVGKDRTGVAIAVVLEAIGVERGEIAAEYAAGSDNIPVAMARLRQMPTYGDAVDVYPPEAWVSEPESILRFLAGVDDRFGGVHALLAEQGVDGRVLDVLRDRLTEAAG